MIYGCRVELCRQRPCEEATQCWLAPSSCRSEPPVLDRGMADTAGKAGARDPGREGLQEWREGESGRLPLGDPTDPPDVSDSS